MSIASVAGQFKTEIKIDPEFESFLPALSEQEFKELEQNLVRDGVREPLVTWCGLLIDGHNRWKVIQKHSLLYETRENHGLNSRAEVKKWQYDNQNGKRNLTIERRVAMAVKLEPVYAELARERQLVNLKQFKNKEKENDQDFELQGAVPPQVVERQVSGKRAGEALVQAAKSAGVGAETVRRYKEILEAAPEMEQDIQSGTIKIGNAYHQLKKKKHRENLKTKEWPNGKYRVILTDPPWQYGDQRSGHGGAEDHYPTMSIEELCAMPVRDLADDNSVLFMWVTAPILFESVKVVEAWGFTYKTNIIWDKVVPYIGNYTMVQHEHLIIATKGSCLPDVNKLSNSIQTIKKPRKHSEKPEEFRKIIEGMYQYGNKIELFARRKVDGWEVWGNDQALSKDGVV